MPCALLSPVTSEALIVAPEVEYVRDRTYARRGVRDEEFVTVSAMSTMAQDADAARAAPRKSLDIKRVVISVLLKLPNNERGYVTIVTLPRDAEREAIQTQPCRLT